MINSINAKRTQRRPSPLFMFHNEWHVPMMGLYMVVVLIHMLEHLLQMYQLVVLGWARPAAGGLLGLWSPQLAMAEVLHFSYNLFQLVGLLVLLGGFRGQARKFWVIACCLQGWHFFEHALLQAQWLTRIYLYNGPKPMSVLEIFLPRIELHFIYNMMVVIPTLIAVYFYIKGRAKNTLVQS
ncbi:MAG: hypothetical protein K8L97_26660 [Anaerolineae bacterium]|nr:hypothetical protein [Anaerolineae bacterium]